MKTQKQFFEALEEELRYLKAQEINEIIKHYRDKINTELDYGVDEEKIIKNLPEPHDIAKEIYQSRGISFLEIQKRKYRRKEIATAIVSSLIIVLLAFLFISVNVFIGKIFLDINKLFSNILVFKSILDIILTISIVISLDIVILSIYIFIIDLFYIIITHFLSNVLKAIKKTNKLQYKFLDFSISGKIKNLCKGKNALAILLICFIGLALLLGTGSLFTKGYIYRSFNNAPSFVKNYEFDERIKDINVNGTNANVSIEVDQEIEKIVVEYGFEFASDVSINIIDACLDIKNVGSKTFGMFGLLDEPTPLVKIKLPSISYLRNINITLNEGTIYLKELQNPSLNVNLDIYSNEIYLENPNLGKLVINECYKTNTKIANLKETDEMSWITTIDIFASTGSIALEKVKANDFTITNDAAKIVMKTCDVENLKIKNTGGNVLLYNVFGSNLDYESNSQNNILDDLMFEQANFTSNKAGTITITRLATRINAKFTTHVSGNIIVSRIKSKKITVNNESGNIIFNYINQNDVTSEKDNEETINIKQKYNSFTVGDTTLEGVSNGPLYINRSILNNVNLEQNKTSLQISDSSITNKAVFNVNNAKNLTFTNVTGLNTHFILKDTELVYYNEVQNSSDTKFYVKFLSASLRPDTNVNWEVEADE